MELIDLITGFILGAVLAGLIVYNRLVGSGQYVSQKNISDNYAPKVVLSDRDGRIEALQNDLNHKNVTIIDLSKDLASLEQINANLDEKLNAQKEELTLLQQRFQTEFENIANRLLEEKSQRFSQQNQSQINDLLNPLREKIKDFEENMSRRFLDETQQRISLKTEIEGLVKLNQQLSSDANNLASALRGNSKVQGDWGEMQLEKLLEKSGLLKGVHYDTQYALMDENRQQRRPDFVIQLPENKQLVLDAKVSLTAFEQFFNQEDPSVKTRFLKAHIDSLRTHVRGLSDKNYNGLYQLNSLDYVIMFVPIESALSFALQEDNDLFTDALDKNVLIVTPTTLLATMRTVGFIWKQENQKKYVLEIARQSGLLYDKFVAFVDDLKTIGSRLDSAQSAYEDAMNKLNDSRKYGDTLVGRAERIRELGAKATKRLSKDMLNTDFEEPLSIEGEKTQKNEQD
ncbi:MAG: DNA recombination protein RmuC [Saprospiraceae bacterium]|nr:DNA recombination protein RmuC [Saprospiraceae bacterium]